jgi:hypothetical protein
VVLTILMYPAFLSFYSPLKMLSHTWDQSLFSISLFILATCSASTFFIVGQRELLGKMAGWKTVLYMPLLMALGVGVSLNNCLAVLEAIWGAMRGKPSEFVRTPKYGVTGLAKAAWQSGSVWTLRKLSLPIIEIAFGCYMTSWIFISIYYQFCLQAVPFLCIFAGGYFYVGFNSLYALYRMAQEAREAEAALLEAAVEPVST